MPLGLRVLLPVYTFLIEAVVWVALVPALWVHARLTRSARVELAQRLGRVPLRSSSTTSARPIIVHGVSVGEMNAAEPLVAALGAAAQRVWLTSGTAAGLSTAQRLARIHSTIDDVAYLPWDRRAVRRWLRAAQPSAVVVMETEIWPHLFTACAALQIPLFIANGRIRPGDVWKYRLGSALIGPVLRSATWIGVQSPEERERWLSIGAPADRVEVAGNLKFDAALDPPPTPPFDLHDASGRPVIVAGSTHDSEERWLIECACALARDGRPVRLVLAPRHVSRADAVVRIARSLGCQSLAWSEWRSHTTAPWDVLVLDAFGLLRPCYADADIVVIGGTFVPVGGHNLLEAAALARPMVIGPHVSGIAAMLAPFDDADAVVRVSGDNTARALTEACRRLIDDPTRARAMGEAAAAVCQRGAGSAARYARAIATRCRVPVGDARSSAR
ncbi:MAG: hypothetical protein KA205_00650 [Acidobacteria bacterium]|nr:hypothetical protein [Acidobacteriota bacterium]